MAKQPCPPSQLDSTMAPHRAHLSPNTLSTSHPSLNMVAQVPNHGPPHRKCLGRSSALGPPTQCQGLPSSIPIPWLLVTQLHFAFPAHIHSRTSTSKPPLPSSQLQVRRLLPQTLCLCTLQLQMLQLWADGRGHGETSERNEVLKEKHTA